MHEVRRTLPLSEDKGHHVPNLFSVDFNLPIVQPLLNSIETLDLKPAWGSLEQEKNTAFVYVKI